MFTARVTVSAKTRAYIYSRCETAFKNAMIKAYEGRQERDWNRLGNGDLEIEAYFHTQAQRDKAQAAMETCVKVFDIQCFEHYDRIPGL